jgi:putative endonuclease
VFVCILSCPDGSFYVGSAKDVNRRISLHQAGRGAKFTHDHLAVKLVYVEGPFDLTEAVRREFQLKRWSHAKKLALIRGDSAKLKTLSRSRD